MSYNPDTFGRTRYAARTAVSVPNPPAGEVVQFFDSATNHLSQKDSTGAVIDLAAGGGGAFTDNDRASVHSVELALMFGAPTYI